MAVTATVSDVARSIRAVVSTEVTAELTDLLAYASGEVTRIAPNAPDAAHNRAAIAIVGYIYDRPTAGRAMLYSNVLRNSGAGAMLLPYRTHRAGSTGKAGALEGVTQDVVGGVFDGFNLPAPAVAFRIGWSQTMVKLGAVFTRANDHPIDGANVGDTDGLAVPPFPPAINTDEELHLWIWVAGDPLISALVDEFDTSYLEFMTDEGALSLEGVAGTAYVSFNRFFSLEGLILKVVIPGEVIASRAWVTEQLARAQA